MDRSKEDALWRAIVENYGERAEIDDRGTDRTDRAVADGASVGTTETASDAAEGSVDDQSPAADPAADPAAVALALVGFANGCGGQDNITAALARLDPGAGHNGAPAATTATAPAAPPPAAPAPAVTPVEQEEPRG